MEHETQNDPGDTGSARTFAQRGAPATLAKPVELVELQTPNSALSSVDRGLAELRDAPAVRRPPYGILLDFDMPLDDIGGES